MRETRKPGTVYTFYSYKGGVGRSMALANIATLLSRRGRKVLAVDFDLEAPGLQRFFQQCLDSERNRVNTPGVVELFSSIREGSSLGWEECIFTARPISYGEPISIISAGKSDNKYTERVRQLNFSQLFEQHDLGHKLEQIREEWRAAYDVVLIDSRTGITDIGGICTIHLPDVLVAFFTTNDQSIEGTRHVLRRAREELATLPLNRHRLITIPILARDESIAENDLGQKWQDHAALQLSEFFEEWLPKDVRAADAIRMFKIPNEARWSFGEGLPVLNDAQLIDSTKIGFAYEELASFFDAGLELLEIPRARAVAKEAALARANEERRASELKARRLSMIIQVGAAALVTLLIAFGLLINSSEEDEREMLATNAPPDAGKAVAYRDVPYSSQHSYPYRDDGGNESTLMPRPVRPLVELWCDSDPPAMIKVFAHGKVRASGTSPLVVRLPPGIVEIEVIGSGGQNFLKRESITLEPLPKRQQHTVTVGKGMLKVNTFPASHVKLDGLALGYTPLVVQLYEGIHQVELECDRVNPNCPAGDAGEVTQAVKVEVGKTTDIKRSWQ